MRLAIAIALVACSPSHQPAPVAAPPTAPIDATAADAVADPFASCNVLPQPSKPGHTSVEPDDMICMHGETPYACPPSSDLAAAGCRFTPTPNKSWVGRGAWCCPGR